MRSPTTPPYLVKNFLLTIKAEWMLNQTTLTLVKDSQESIQKYAESEGKEGIKNVLQNYPKVHCNDVYSVGLFTEEFCDMMLDEIENMKRHFNFSPNPDEDNLRQIPEIVLSERCPELYNSMLGVALNVLNPIFMSIWQRYIDSASSIQIANYNLENKKQGAWHHDSSADISVVVPLNTGDYEGGGTEFFNRGVVEPLPRGHALFFPSFTHLHRGLAVGEGDRYLLVFCLKGPKDD